jgi:hypothetical protein
MLVKISGMWWGVLGWWLSSVLGGWAQPVDTALYSYDQTTLLWRGFQHKWSYHHRMQRLADFARTTSCDSQRCYTQMLHGAAPGAQPDRMLFRSYATLISANRVRFRAGKYTCIIEGRQGEDLKFSQELALPCSDSLPARQDRYTVVLNGFEVLALDKPRQVKHLSVSVTDGYYEPQDSVVRFEVAGGAHFDCTLLDCGLGPKTLRYQVTVYYLILTGDEGYGVRKAVLPRRYFWDNRLEYRAGVATIPIRGDTSRAYRLAVPAFKRLSLTLDKAQNFVEWNWALPDLKYDPTTHRAVVYLDCLFKQWTEGMKDNMTYRKHARFAAKKAGLVDFQLELALLQFTDACVKHETIRGEVAVPASVSITNLAPSQYEALGTLVRLCR